jgi:hypothetical protein
MKEISVNDESSILIAAFPRTRIKVIDSTATPIEIFETVTFLNEKA